MNYSTISKTKWAYLAGIIDGEGTIYIGAYSRNKKTGVLHYQTSIQVSNTDQKLIEWLHDTFGGGMGMYTPRQTPKNSRCDVYRWAIWADLDKICTYLLPYLIVKKNQAEIMIKMRATFDSQYSGRTKISKALPEATIALRHSLYLELKSLHLRNLKKTPCAVSPT